MNMTSSGLQCEVACASVSVTKQSNSVSAKRQPRCVAGKVTVISGVRQAMNHRFSGLYTPGAQPQCMLEREAVVSE